MNQEPIGTSKEEYLKTILLIQKRFGACRAADVSKRMKVSNSSVCIALKKLEYDGLIVRDDWRILLTERGRSIAEEVNEKGSFFLELFRAIGVSEKTAIRDACQVEHAVSGETFRKLKEYIQKSGDIK